MAEEIAYQFTEDEWKVIDARFRKAAEIKQAADDAYRSYLESVGTILEMRGVTQGKVQVDHDLKAAVPVA